VVARAFLAALALALLGLVLVLEAIFLRVMVEDGRGRLG
jgi:hypothetical protein